MPDTAVGYPCCTAGCHRRYGPSPRWRWWWRSVGAHDAGGVGALVHRFAGARRRSRAVVAVDLGGPDGDRVGRRGARLARQPVVASFGIAAGGAPLPAERGRIAESVGRL